MDGLSEFVEIKYLDPREAVFSRSPGGFLQLTVDGTFYPRVTLYRTFPFTYPEEYISVRDMEGNEIGLLRSFDGFAPEIVEAFREELARRYFAPKITRIKSLKEEFGYSYWEVDTDAGPRRFTVRDLQQSLILLSPEHILILDVDGNRFEIPDYTKLDPTSRRYIENLI